MTAPRRQPGITRTTSSTETEGRFAATVTADRMVMRDLKTLARFIDIYCRDQHRHAPRVSVRLKTHDVAACLVRPLELCGECGKLLAHSFVKRANCPLDPKPACKKCPTHCYAPKYRARIRDVMKYSARKLVLRGRLDYLLRLVS